MDRRFGRQIGQTCLLARVARRDLTRNASSPRATPNSHAVAEYASSDRAVGRRWLDTRRFVARLVPELKRPGGRVFEHPVPREHFGMAESWGRRCP